MSPRQIMSLGDTLLQLLFRFIVSTVSGAYLPPSYVGSTSALSGECVQCLIWPFSVVPELHGFLVCCPRVSWMISKWCQSLQLLLVSALFSHSIIIIIIIIISSSSIIIITLLPLYAGKIIDFNKVFFNNYNEILFVYVNSYLFSLLFVIYVRFLCSRTTAIIGLMAVVLAR